jgi:hypothetical protein
METFILTKSPRDGKKWRVTGERGEKVDFGAEGYSDLTMHRDPERQQAYIARHFPRENWNREGIKSAGFWSRWILWNKPSLDASIKDTEKRFNIRIIKK